MEGVHWRGPLLGLPWRVSAEASSPEGVPCRYKTWRDPLEVFPLRGSLEVVCWKEPLRVFAVQGCPVG
jgi:hypothetical protein